MKLTPLGIVVESSAWAVLGTGIVLGSWGIGVAGFGALAVLAGTRRDLVPRHADVQRELLGEPRQGNVLTVRTAARHDGPGVLLVESPVPLGFTLLRERRTTDRRQTVLEQDIQAVGVGAHTWAPVRVRATDAWGLRAQEREVEAPIGAAIVPSPEWAVRGRRLGLRNPVQATVRALLASERSLEVERVREHAPGDSMRDIDWKATSRMGELQVRERERHIPRPVTVVLDCGPSMRIQRNDTKLLTATRIAHGLLAAARGAGTASHLVSVQEAVTLCQAVGGPADAERTLSQVMAACPPLPASSLLGRPPGAAAILAALPDSPGLIVVLLDGEMHPDLVLELLPLLKRRGNIAVVLPATAAHLYRRHEARGPVLRAMRAWRRERARVQAAAKALKVPVYVAWPGTEDDLLEKLARGVA